MKNILKYILFILLVVIILPNLCTKKKKEKVTSNPNNVQTSQENINEKNQYDYSKYKTIKLYHSKTTQIEEIPIDQYLYGVLSAEMPASYEKEALKAQAIVARTYTIYQIMHSKR